MKPVKYVKGHHAKMQARRRIKEKAMRVVERQTPNEIAHLMQRAGRDLLKTEEWRALRQKVIEKYGRKCMQCGFIPRKGQCINVDHIKPRAYFPELAMSLDNLQVLCPRCNQRKGNLHCIDFRPAL